MSRLRLPHTLSRSATTGLGSGLLLALAACGGRAASPEESDGTPDIEAPEEESVDALPPEFEVLELRLLPALRLGPQPVADSARVCPGGPYTNRVKVNMKTRQVIRGTCEQRTDGYASSSSNASLSASQLRTVQNAYDALRASTTSKCTPERGAFTLDLEIDGAADLLLGDADHSSCPAPGVESDRFVEGLQDLYEVLSVLENE